MDGCPRKLYELVDRERSLQGMSWTRLEELSGVSRSTVSKWRNRVQPPQPRTVVAVADALGIDRLKALQSAGLANADEQPGGFAGRLARAAVIIQQGDEKEERRGNA